MFEGAGGGLRNGGSVNFNGIRVGEVVSVKLDNPRRVVALAMVENNTPIRKDTLVGLEFQGLTGVAAISLKGGEEARACAAARRGRHPVAQRPIPTKLQDVTEAIRGTLQNINKIVADNQRVGEQLAARTSRPSPPRWRATPRGSTASWPRSTA